MQYPIPARRRLVGGLVASAVVTVSGCDFFRNDGKKEPASKTLQAKDRPPLQIVVVDGPFSDELLLRWQAFSEQPIQIESVTSQQAALRPADSTDVWIYPAHLLGDWVASERIIPLPTAAAGKPYQSDSESVGESGGTIESWPARWRLAARYGESYYGLPLGAPLLTLAGRNVPIDSLDRLEDTIKPVEDRTTAAAETWNGIFKAVSERTAPSESNWRGTLEALSSEQKDALVDRFLWIAATTNAKRRGLFDLTRLQPRLLTEEFLLAANVLVRLAELFPSTMLSTHSDAWKELTTSKGDGALLTIAFPPRSLDLPNESENRDAIRCCKLATNHCLGFHASIGRKTRQTSVAAQFVAWLSEAEQRDAFAKRTNQVERWPGQPNPDLIQSDVRAYYNVCNREQRLEPLTLAIRFAHASKYRDALAQALVSILKDPDKTPDQLGGCVEVWNNITDSVGMLTQRSSVESSMGFGV
ncbi:hypothetical protein VN12_09020 [Pirellula sp. SH-Sr6A]|uniref:hypothetical protein n=1 Tax=Pirellula sp. SH-Sr6A TaxID=1632865 RepID=UPI00078C8B34|nr:hypothetical protein [Pirellula sp. SH-Sr6A]AMV32251.1 hypothetical protein VN12_09020 [Pirellula sp. SH-Sr6A]